jgi:hypothetical protein
MVYHCAMKIGELAKRAKVNIDTIEPLAKVTKPTHLNLT